MEQYIFEINGMREDVFIKNSTIYRNRACSKKYTKEELIKMMEMAVKMNFNTFLEMRSNLNLNSEE